MEKNDEMLNKIVIGLEMTYKRMIQFKREKNAPVVVSRNGIATLVSPFEMPDEVKVENPLKRQKEQVQAFRHQ